MATVFATVSTPGPAGPTGPPGYSPQYIVAAGVPAAATGNNGDMYINSATGDVYGPKTAGAWGAIAVNIKGPTGAAGPAGYSPQYIVASGVPAAATGNNGDMYINSATSDVYGPKALGAWGGIVCNIKGSTGAQGPPGVAYTPRGAWASGTTYAQGDEATYSGALYISLQSGNLGNVPSTSPSFWQPVGSGGMADPTTTLGDLIVRGSSAPATRFGLGSNGQVLTVNTGQPLGVNWATVTLVPAGSTGQVQFNNAGAFGASSNLFWDNTNFMLGIGTATPGARLEVDITDTVTNPFSVPALELKNTNTTVGNMTSIRNVNSGGGANAEINFINTGQGVYPNNGGAIAFSTYDGVGGGGTIKMYINPAGLVGIGTASPQVALQISRPSGQEASIAVFQLGIGSGHFGVKPSDSNVYLVNSYTTGTLAGSNGIVIDRNGNVGIGTTSPASRLDIEGPQDATGGISIGTSGADPTVYGYQIYRRSDGLLGIIGNQSGSAGFVFGNATERMRITTAGNVGIGKTAPAYALDVTGSCNITGSYLVNGTAIGGGGITTQNVVTGSRAFNTVYQNTTGKPMMVGFTINLTAGTITGYADSSGSPSTVVAGTGAGGGTGSLVGMAFWVLPNYYYKIGGSGAITAWVEWY